MARRLVTTGSPSASTYKVQDGWTGDRSSELSYTMSLWKEIGYSESFNSPYNPPPKGAGQNWSGDNGSNYFASQMNGGIGTAGASAYNKAYEDFRTSAYEKASTLTAFRERQKTYDMLTSRLLKIGRGAAYLVNRDLKGFLNEFDLAPKKKDRKVRFINGAQYVKGTGRKKEPSGNQYVHGKKLSEYWLEYWMGWAPTVGDIYTLTEFLGKPYPDDEIRAGGSAPASERLSTLSTALRTNYQADCKVTVHLRGKVRVKNAALFTMEGAGILNPAVTAWELIPMSFIVDWFVNVKQILGCVSDFAGLEIYDLWVSSVLKGNTTVNWEARQHAGRAMHTRQCVLMRRVRKTSLPFVTPEVRMMKVTAERAATVASLAVMVLLGDKKAAKKVLKMKL